MFIGKIVDHQRAEPTRLLRETPCLEDGERRAVARGSSNQNVVPRRRSLSTPISPPISSTSCSEIASPRPVPPNLRVVELSAWVKGSNRRPRMSAGMPMPVSATSKRDAARRRSPARAASTRDRDVAALGELDRVADEVDQDLAEARRVAAQPRGRARSTRHGERRAPSGARCGASSATASRPASRRSKSIVSSSSLPGLDLREVEDVVDDASAAPRALSRIVAGVLALLGVEVGVEQQRRSCRGRRSSASGSRGSCSRGTPTWRGSRPRPAPWPPRAVRRRRAAR